MEFLDSFLPFVSLISLLIIGFIFLKFYRGQKFRNAILLTYTVGLGLWFGWLFYLSVAEGGTIAEIAGYLPIYAFLWLNILLLQIARDYLKLPASGRKLFSVVGFLSLGLLALQLLSTGTISAFVLPSQIVIFILLSLWTIVQITGLIEFFGAYRRDSQPLHRNRLLTWLPIPFLNLLAGIFLFLGNLTTAGISLLIGIGLLAFFILAPNLPDLINLFRRLLRFALTVSAIFVYILLFLLLFGLIRELIPALNQLIAGILIIILASFLSKPAIDLVSRAANILVPEVSLQAEQIVREFSRGLRSSPTLEDLVHQLITRIQEILPVNEVVILNIEKASADGSAAYKISSFQNLPGHLDPLLLPVEDPICQQFLGQNKALSQYQIDYTPELEDTTPITRSWFENSRFDLFIPIVAKGEWIGLICLGSKENGTPYTSGEIELLNSLSDQTAIAFENARLISGLTRLNNDYRRAYTALERTNIRLEQTVRQLEKLDHFKSDLITILSHELRTPMTLIAGYAQILLEEPDILQHPGWADIVQGIAHGTDRLDDIVGAILDMASIDARTLDLSIKSTDLHALVNETVQSLGEDLAQRKILIQFEGLVDLPFLETDAQLLAKALRQVLSNSIKYSPDSSRILLQGQQLLPEDSPIGENSIELTVSDQGIGLDPDQLDIVFEKFYQTTDASKHSSGKTKFKGGGPGLGLAIVKGIVTELHGMVWAESAGHNEEQYPGTSIHIVLPLRREKPSNHQVRNTEKPPQGD